LLRQDPRPPSQRVSGFLHSSPTLAPTHTQGLGRGSGAQLPHQQGFVTLGGNRKPHQRCQATATAPAPLRRKQYCACAKRACDYLTRAREAGPAASEGGARMTDGGGATSDPRSHISEFHSFTLSPQHSNAIDSGTSIQPYS
jgi:hypothetical protein